jgi:hypothetical protein
VLVATPYHVIPSCDVATVFNPDPTAIQRFPSHDTSYPPDEKIPILVDIPVHEIPSVE